MSTHRSKDKLTLAEYEAMRQSIALTLRDLNETTDELAVATLRSARSKIARRIANKQRAEKAPGEGAAA
jgi:hypothetical protein